MFGEVGSCRGAPPPARLGLPFSLLPCCSRVSPSLQQLALPGLKNSTPDKLTHAARAGNAIPSGATIEPGNKLIEALGTWHRWTK
jgi:hypothetical protein